MISAAFSGNKTSIRYCLSKFCLELSNAFRLNVFLYCKYVKVFINQSLAPNCQLAFEVCMKIHTVSH